MLLGDRNVCGTTRQTVRGNDGDERTGLLAAIVWTTERSSTERSGSLCCQGRARRAALPEQKVVHKAQRLSRKE